MLGAPLVVDRRIIGVLHVGSFVERTFTAAEAMALEFVADRVAAAIEDRGADMERAAAQVLQRSLLPPSLPPCPGIEWATRYVPAERGGVGGDWYDAFRLPGGQVWVMVGDVEGHGLVPAVVMGRLRAALRSYALEGHPPEEVLRLADRKLGLFEPGRTASVMCATLHPPYDTIRLACAGHLPPILAACDEPATVVDVSPGVLLGAVDAPSFERVEIPFAPGSVLVAYTDGLVERRGEPLDVGIERLRSRVRADEPDAVCRDAMDALIGNRSPGDDVAVLAMRHAVECSSLPEGGEE